MATMVDRWLELAEFLVKTHPRSSAMRRRAVSSAYYALFHAVAKVCTDEIAAAVGRASAEYDLVYRSLSHEAVRRAFKEGPLAANKRLSGIGESFAQLQTERIKADYMPPVLDVIAPSKAEELVAEAKRALAELEALSDGDRQMLVVRLLIKDPKR